MNDSIGTEKTIKAIETVYAGYRFRSRLEARWAVFFDALNIRYEYEKEGFDLGDGMRYLPDFWLPEQRCWIEIKGQAPTEEEQDKAARLNEATDHPVFIFWGAIECPDGSYTPSHDSAFMLCGGWDSTHWWCECPVCGSLGIEFEGRSARLPCRCLRKIDPHDDRGHNYDSLRLKTAYEAARQVRFEHGETPLPRQASQPNPAPWYEVEKQSAIARMKANWLLQEALRMEPRIQVALDAALHQRSESGYNRSRRYGELKESIYHLVGWAARDLAISRSEYYEAVVSTIADLLPDDVGVAEEVMR